MRQPRRTPIAPRAAWAGVAFVGMLVVVLVVSLVLAFGSLVLLVAPDPVERDLVERGVGGPGERILAMHRHGEGDAACVLLDGAIVATRSDGVDVRLPLADTTIATTERPLQVTFTSGDQRIVCPFRADEGIDTFAALARQAASRQRGRRWRPVDPRVRGLLEGDGAAP